MTEEVLQLLSDDPMVVLNRGYRAKERIAARQKRIEEWRQIAESITRIPRTLRAAAVTLQARPRIVLSRL